MPTSIDAQGQTVDEAIQVALNKLGVTRDKVEIKVLHHPRTGFLGLGARRAKVQATVRADVMSDGEEFDMSEGRSRSRRRSSRRGRGSRGRGDRSEGEKSGSGQQQRSRQQGGQQQRSRQQGGQQQRSRQQDSQQQDSQARSRQQDSAQGGARDSQQRGRGGNGDRGPRRGRSRADSTTTVPATPEVQVDPAVLEKASGELMSAIVSHMGFEAKVETSRGDQGGEVVVTVTSEAEGLLIGRRGQTLDSFEHLINRMVTRGESAGDRRVIIDIGGYRERRRETLVELASRLSERALSEGRKLEVSPMSPNDRKIFQEALGVDSGVKARVVGTGFYRRVEISPDRATVADDSPPPEQTTETD
ncbi:MAG: RNA-binding cell elongation regulator Jag/EloR [Deltaproteobacteria bacterium]